MPRVDPYRLLVRSVVVLAAIGALVGACGSDDDDARDDAALEATIADVLVGVDDPSALQYTAAEASCVATDVVDAIGADRLRSLGVEEDDFVALTALDLTDEEGDVVYDALDDCLDLQAQLAGMIGGPSVAQPVKDCAAERYIASGLFREALLTPEFDEGLNRRIDLELSEAFAACESAS